MFLAFNISDIIRIPFGYVLDFLYRFTTNYGLALILFAIIVRLVLIPINAKSKKSMMKMSRLQPRIQEIQRKYADDKQKQNEAIQRLQQEEGATMGCGGCLWSLVPLLILLPLFQVIRQPLVYMLHLDADTANGIVEIVKAGMPELFTGTAGTTYSQVLAASHIPEFSAQILEKYPDIAPRVLEGLNFSFLGIDLGIVPQWKIWTWEAYDWAHFGAFLLPVASTGVQFLSMLISQKQNNSVITNEKGLQDEEMAKKSQANQSTQTMLYMMPLMTLWIGFTVPGALSIYWLIQGVISAVQDLILTKHFRKVYDEEDAIRRERAAEQEKIEAEKERIRAERRAANPDGITDNTSKKKLQKKLQNEQEAAKAAAKKEYEAKKGIVTEEETEKVTMSGIADRPYCKGRNYDPNRYGKTEE